ncbi:MAG TPA: fibronectin type III domain-containing protein [Opitutaceae bacterium]
MSSIAPSSRTLRVHFAFLALTVLALRPIAWAQPEKPAEFAAHYGLNPDFPATFTGAADVTLSWASTDATVTRWKITKKAWGQQAWETITLSDPAARSYRDTGALKDTPTINYQIAAINAAGQSAYATVTAWRLAPSYAATPTWSWPNAEVWIANPPGTSAAVVDHGENRLSFKDRDQWPQLAEQIDGVALFYSSIQNASPAELRALADALAATPTRKRIKVGIELGVFLSTKLRSGNPAGSRAGVESFAAHHQALKRFTDPVAQGGAGGVIDFLFMDGPIHRAMYPKTDDSPHTLPSASEQVVQWMEQFKRVYPHLGFQLICNFSSWSYAGVPARNSRPQAHGPAGFGNYDDVVATLLPLAARRGVPFTGVLTDYAYDAFNNEAATDQPALVRGRDYRGRLLALRNRITSLDLGPGGAPLTFGMLCNSNRGTIAGNYATRVELFNYFEELHELGLTPDVVIIESWNRNPTHWMPETRPDSMTHIVRRALQRLRYQRDTPAATP